MKKRVIPKFPAIVAIAAVVSIAATLIAQSRPGFPLSVSV